jgi:NAD-dependent SIR2 family protein deacetylase
METTVAPRYGAHVSVRCEKCGDMIRMSDRQFRHKLQQGRPNYCPLCRTERTIAPKPAHYQYWLDRFTLAEIREMGSAIWE